MSNDQTERDKFETERFDKWFDENVSGALRDEQDLMRVSWQARAALDGGAVSRDALSLKTIITAAERAYDTLYQHGDFHLADELSKAIVIARREVPYFASLDNSLPPETPTDKLVNDFGVALKSKLNSAREKYGHEDEAWRDNGWLPELLEQLQTHLDKGDPRDVAAYCAFAWYHNWSLSALRAPQQPSSEREQVAKLITDEVLTAARKAYIEHEKTKSWRMRAALMAAFLAAKKEPKS